jgi:hypothetical protein
MSCSRHACSFRHRTRAVFVQRMDSSMHDACTCSSPRGLCSHQSWLNMSQTAERQRTIVTPGANATLGHIMGRISFFSGLLSDPTKPKRTSVGLRTTDQTKFQVQVRRIHFMTKSRMPESNWMKQNRKNPLGGETNTYESHSTAVQARSSRF